MFAMIATAARVLASNLYRCFGITRPSGAWFRDRDLLIERLPPRIGGFGRQRPSV
jgi:hypothetical protein